MKTTMVIFLKELKDTLRDRRTVFMMIGLPILLVFLLMTVTTKLSMSYVKEAKEKVLNVGLVTNGSAAAFREKLASRTDVKLEEKIDTANIETLIKDKTYDFIILFEEGFDGKVAEKGSGVVQLYYRASREIDIAMRRIKGALNEYKQELLSQRLQGMELEEAFVKPFELSETDYSTTKEKVGETVGGLLPYFFILFCFLGSMYPAIDLAAGEKERATMETLLTSPASRLQIVIGKFLVVTLAGLASAAVAMLGIYLSLKQADELPKRIIEGLFRLIAPGTVGMMLSLLLPLSIFFAAALLSMSVFARSFKEAQSIMTPMNFLVLFPAMAGMFPGIKLNTVTALVPVLNVSLATKEIISGTIKTGLLVEVYASLIILAIISLIFCTQWFKREDIIFRGI